MKKHIFNHALMVVALTLHVFTLPFPVFILPFGVVAAIAYVLGISKYPTNEYFKYNLRVFTFAPWILIILLYLIFGTVDGFLELFGPVGAKRTTDLATAFDLSIKYGLPSVVFITAPIVNSYLSFVEWRFGGKRKSKEKRDLSRLTEDYITDENDSVLPDVDDELIAYR